jgi:hypothetical protein
MRDKYGFTSQCNGRRPGQTPMSAIFWHSRRKRQSDSNVFWINCQPPCTRKAGLQSWYGRKETKKNSQILGFRFARRMWRKRIQGITKVFRPATRGWPNQTAHARPKLRGNCDVQAAARANPVNWTLQKWRRLSLHYCLSCKGNATQRRMITNRNPGCTHGTNLAAVGCTECAGVLNKARPDWSNRSQLASLLFIVLYSTPSRASVCSIKKPAAGVPSIWSNHYCYKLSWEV